MNQDQTKCAPVKHRHKVWRRGTVRQKGVFASTIKVVLAENGHILPLACHMREADRYEVMASHGHTPQEALHNAFWQSTLAWTLFIDDTPAMMWGVASDTWRTLLCGVLSGGTLSGDTLSGDTLSGGALSGDVLAGRVGVPWMLGTDALHTAGLSIARQSRQYVSRMQAMYPYLENYVHSANVASIRWLVWCGFFLAPEPEPYGRSGELFYHFWR